MVVQISYLSGSTECLTIPQMDILDQIQQTTGVISLMNSMSKEDAHIFDGNENDDSFTVYDDNWIIVGRNMFQTSLKTWMHSSRMPTTRSLPYGGGLCLGVSVQGGLCPRVLCPGGSLSGGVSDQWGSLSGRPPLLREWLTDRCNNITFPQLRLWAVGVRNKIYRPNLHDWLEPNAVYYFRVSEKSTSACIITAISWYKLRIKVNTEIMYHRKYCHDDY